MSSHIARCAVCGNLAPYCPCGTKGTLPAGPPPKTRYQKQHDAIVMEETGEYGMTGMGPHDYRPTPMDFVLHALGGTGESLYLCERGCGVTTDHECDYGGWHGGAGHESVELAVVEA